MNLEHHEDAVALRLLDRVPSVFEPVPQEAMSGEDEALRSNLVRIGHIQIQLEIIFENPATREALRFVVIASGGRVDRNISSLLKLHRPSWGLPSEALPGGPTLSWKYLGWRRSSIGEQLIRAIEANPDRGSLEVARRYWATLVGNQERFSDDRNTFQIVESAAMKFGDRDIPTDEGTSSFNKLPLWKPAGYTASELRDETTAAGVSVSEGTWKNIRKAAKLKGGRGRRYSTADIRKLADAAQTGNFRKGKQIAEAWRKLIGDGS